MLVQAARMGGQPWMISFSGMGEVLGWPPRLPLVADSDRPRILASWARHCAGCIPRQRYVPFAAVRHLSPEDFVAMLAEDLQVSCNTGCTDMSFALPFAPPPPPPPPPPPLLHTVDPSWPCLQRICK